MRAAAGLDPDDPLQRQRLGAHQELGVLAGVDVVGDRRDRPAVAHPLAELVHQRGLAGADRPADADPQRPVRRARRRRPRSVLPSSIIRIPPRQFARRRSSLARGGGQSGAVEPACTGSRAASPRGRRASAMPPIASGGAASAAAATAAASGISAGGDPLALGLAERDQPHAGRDDVGGEGLQEERRGRRERQRQQPRRHGRPPPDRPSAGTAIPQAAAVVRAKAAPCAIVSRCRSAEGASASASSATGAGSSARQAAASSIASVRPAPNSSRSATQAARPAPSRDPPGLDRPFQPVANSCRRRPDSRARTRPRGSAAPESRRARSSRRAPARRDRRRRRRGGGRGCGRGRRRRPRGGTAPSPAGWRRRAAPASPRSHGRAGPGSGPSPISAGVCRLPMCQASRASTARRAGDLDQRLLGRLDRDQPAVLEQEGVAIAASTPSRAGRSAAPRRRRWSAACAAGTARGSRAPPGRPPAPPRRGGSHAPGARSSAGAGPQRQGLHRPAAGHPEAAQLLQRQVRHEDRRRELAGPRRPRPPRRRPAAPPPARSSGCPRRPDRCRSASEAPCDSPAAAPRPGPAGSSRAAPARWSRA